VKRGLAGRGWSFCLRQAEGGLQQWLIGVTPTLPLPQMQQPEHINDYRSVQQAGIGVPSLDRKIGRVYQRFSRRCRISPTSELSST